MNLDYLIYYLAGINIIGFILMFINSLFLKKQGEGKLDLAVAAAVVMGGTPAVILGMFLFDRRAEKSNMMLRVITICVLIIQVVLLLLLSGAAGEEITCNAYKFFKENRILFYYLLIINAVTFIAFGVDKFLAVHEKSRIKIVTLLGFSFAGGALGGLAGMYLFHHKTRKNYFYIGLPLIILSHIAVIFFLMNVL